MLLFNSSIRTVSSLYTMETGMLIEDQFKPVVKIGDIRGVFQDKFWILSPQEWFTLMKGNDSKFANWLYESEEKSSNEEVQCILGYDEVDNSDSKGKADIKNEKKVSFSDDSLPCKDNETEENSLCLGKYKLLFDEENCTVSVWENKTMVIRLNEDFIQEMCRLYEVISLKLELLQKYQFYAIYILSRYINHFIKVKDKDPIEEDIENLNLGNIPKIRYLKIDYSLLDIHICRTLHAEIRTWAVHKILDVIKSIKTFYSRSWIESNHLYI